jgi:polyisoprenoid-binding protein YceI
MLKYIFIGLVILAVMAAGAILLLDQTIFAAAPVSTALPVASTLDLSEPSINPAETTPAQVQQENAPTQAYPEPAASGQAVTGQAANPYPSPDLNGLPGAALLYRIDPQQSEVRYEVGETFFQGNRFATAIGTTSGIAGEILVDYAQPTQSRVGDFVIDVSQFVSDENRRDNYLTRNGLVSSVYPTASFVTVSIEGLPAAVSPGDKINIIIHGDLTVKEITRPVSWQVVLKLQDGQITGSAETQILMSDFQVGPIQLAFLITEDDVKLIFDFVAVEAGN